MKALRTISILSILAHTALAGAQWEKSRLPYRWVYLMFNMQVDGNVGVVSGIMDRAKAAGYNGVVLADYKLTILDLLGDNTERYKRNIGQIKAKADSLGLAFVPGLSGPGYAAGLLAHNPNLAEGLPVRNALFLARGGQAQLVADPAVSLPNGAMENPNGDTFPGWDYQDGPGTLSFADSGVKHGGSYSIRFEHLETDQNGNGRLIKLINVSPYRQYHATAWIKTSAFTRAGSVRIQALTASGKALAYNDIGVQQTQDWTQAHIVFNSLDNNQVRLYFGVWGGKSGKLWLDDLTIEEVGLLNLLRRPATPLTVQGEDGTVYTEGQDFEPVVDPRMGNVPWPGSYEVYHAPPPIVLKAGGRITEGQRLRVSFFHPIVVYSDQVAACMGDPQEMQLVKNEIANVSALLQPSMFFFGHDEIRVANQDPSCGALGPTAGKILALNFQQCYNAVRSARLGGTILVWSDMFDPNHNAVADYYLARGGMVGSWLGVPKDTVIVNWNSGTKRVDSMQFFSGRGHKQILAGYYDGPAGAITAWLNDAEPISGVSGVMYTTWVGNYTDLEAFAKAAWKN